MHVQMVAAQHCGGRGAFRYSGGHKSAGGQGYRSEPNQAHHHGENECSLHDSQSITAWPSFRFDLCTKAYARPEHHAVTGVTQDCEREAMR